MYLQIILLKLLIKFIFASNCTFTDIDDKLRYFDGSELRIVSDSLVALNVDSTSVRFLVLGDWGGQKNYPYRTQLQRNISLLMAQSALRLRTQFQVTLGNNFFSSGVRNINDVRFQRTFENVYDNEALQTPWFNTLGTSDYEGNVVAQIKYTYRSKRWILPSNNYSVEIRVNRSSRALMKIITVDTIYLCDEDDDVGTKLYAEYIERLLIDTRRNNVTFVIVVGHHPVWPYGYSKNCLSEKLKPLLHHYNVKAYFSGNDQLFQHITDTYLNSRVEYFTTGNAAYTRPETKARDDILGNAKLKARSFLGGFIRVQANNTVMSVGYVDARGVNVYNYLIR